MFVDEDCVDSRSDVDDLRTRDCLYDRHSESRPVRYEGCCSYRGRQSCSRLCHAQVANGDPSEGRLSDVVVMELGRQQLS